MECIGNPVFSKVRVSESTRKGKRRCFCVGNPKLIPYETIVRATSGDPEAVEECSCTVKKQATKNKR